jgi:hypothetical protein
MISEQRFGPGAFRFRHLAAGNDGRTGALQGIRTNAITGRRRHPIALDGNRLALGQSPEGPQTRSVCGLQAKSKRPLRSHRLLVHAIEDGLGTFDQFEIGGYGEQGTIRFGARDVRKLEGLLAHARIASLAVNDGLEIG